VEFNKDQGDLAVSVDGISSIVSSHGNIDSYHELIYASSSLVPGEHYLVINSTGAPFDIDSITFTAGDGHNEYVLEDGRVCNVDLTAHSSTRSQDNLIDDVSQSFSYSGSWDAALDNTYKFATVQCVLLLPALSITYVNACTAARTISMLPTLSRSLVTLFNSMVTSTRIMDSTMSLSMAYRLFPSPDYQHSPGRGKESFSCVNSLLPGEGKRY
jgi:hypothetical protein